MFTNLSHSIAQLELMSGCLASLICIAGYPLGLSLTSDVISVIDYIAEPGFVRSLALISPALNAQIFALLQPPAIG